LKKILKNKQGSVLISALFAFFFVTAIVLGLASVTRNQVYQLRLTQDVYEAKALMNISEKYIPSDTEEFKTTLTYDRGVVHIEKEGAENYKIIGHFEDNLSLTKNVYIPNEENDEKIDKKTSEKEHINKNTEKKEDPKNKLETQKEIKSVKKKNIDSNDASTNLQLPIEFE
jgi:hypothetical protein